MWSSKTKPTPANIRKRIDAAIEALAGAELLMKNHGKMKVAIQQSEHARAWASSSRRATLARKP